MNRCSTCDTELAPVINRRTRQATDVTGCPHCDRVCSRHHCRHCSSIRTSQHTQEPS